MWCKSRHRWEDNVKMELKENYGGVDWINLTKGGACGCRSQWPRGLRRRSAAARLLRSWVRIPPGAWIYFCCECCVLSGRSLCDELITRPEESYRLWCVVVCDLETSRMRRPWLALGRSATQKTNYRNSEFPSLKFRRLYCKHLQVLTQYIADCFLRSLRQLMQSWCCIRPCAVMTWVGTTLTLRRLMSYIYGAPILDVSRSHTTTQHSR